jgi:signal transduction histidine kinase
MNKKIKILHLEDSLKDSELIHSIIEIGEIEHEYFLAENKKDYLYILENESIDIILSDYGIPGYNGNEALKIARRNYCHVPFIFVSGTIGEDRAIEAMLNGATDYVIKDKLDRLVPAIKRALHERELEINREKAEEELIIANKELLFQNEEKDKRAAELIIANKELAFQNEEKERRAEELIYARDKAEESDRLKSAFLANMSHEIRTPMNGILGFAELLKEPDQSLDEQHLYIDIIEKCGKRLLSTINDIMSISRVEAGLMTVSISEININEQIHDIYNFFKPEADEKGVHLFVHDNLSLKPTIIKSDEEKVYAVLTNLVKNAIKFTNSGYIEFGYFQTIRLFENYRNGQSQNTAISLTDGFISSSSNPENGHDELTFFVKDTGIGIQQEKLKLVFDRFRQSNESFNRKYEGAGLGLSISKAYVEILGGRIWIESEFGKGSTIYFTIPYNREPEQKTFNEGLITKSRLFTGKKILSER